MNRTAQITNIIEKRQPLANKIEQVKVNLNSLSSELSHLEDHRQQLLGRVDEPSITGRLKEIDFSKIHPNIAYEFFYEFRYEFYEINRCFNQLT